MNFAEMKGQVGNWMRESVDDSLLGDAVNDAIESLALSIITTRIETLLDGPVSLTIGQAQERVQVVSIVDPIVAPVVNNVVAGALPASNLSLAYTLVTESGSETLLSPATAFARLLNNVANLIAPVYVSGALGYYVYACFADGRMARQTELPVDFGMNWQEPITGIIDSPDLPGAPVANSTGDNIFYISHLELQTPEGAYKAWNAADLDSEIMRRAARTLSSTSPYQNYYWDLIGNQQLELRPPTGIGMVPRYFYVGMPRRLRFDNSTIPFTGTPAVSFLRSFALSLIKLALEEYQGSTMWGQRAEQSRMEILKAITKQNYNKNNTVTPYIV